MNRAPQLLAIYDMDKTITRAPTWTPFLIHAAKARAPWRLALLPAAGIAGVGYSLGLIGRARLKEISQHMLLGGRLSPEAMRGLADDFADRIAATGLLDQALARIAADRAEGYRIIMATASHGYYAAAIAARLGIADVVATNAKRDAQGHLLPKLEGENCYGAAKLRMILDWLSREGIKREDAHVRAYSDHVSDAPMLDWADEAFAVNAHGPLTALAKAKGWAAFDWR